MQAYREWMRLALVVLLVGFSSSALAESGVDTGCFGGLDRGECMYSHECDIPTDICFEGRCNCEIGSCIGPAYREVCEGAGCFCEETHFDAGPVIDAGEPDSGVVRDAGHPDATASDASRDAGEEAGEGACSAGGPARPGLSLLCLLAVVLQLGRRRAR